MLKKLFILPSSNMFVQLVRYGFVVAIAFPIDFGLLYLFTEHFHIHYLLSTILAFTVSMLVNFYISIFWVFKNRAERPLWKEISAFFIIGFVGLGLTAFIVWFCTSVLGIHYMVSKLIAVCFVFFWSFGARRLMFARHSRDYLETARQFLTRPLFFGRSIGQVLKSPAFIVLLICLAVLFYRLWTTYLLRPFNSDDVFWQAILLQWQPFDGSTVTLGNSSVYVDKIPFYKILGHFFAPSRDLLFLEAALPASAGFAGFYVASLYFLKRLKVRLTYLTLLPFIWMASFGYAFASLYLNPNWRGFQLGLTFVVFALVAAVLHGEIKLKAWYSKLLAVLLAIYAGLQIYSDPYFLYFTIAPLVILLLFVYAIRKINKRQFWAIASLVGVSLVFSKVFAYVAFSAGVRTTTDYPMEFVDFENLAHTTWNSIHSIIIIFSGNIFGLPLKDLGTLVALLNLSLLGFLTYKLYRYIKGLPRDTVKITLDQIWLYFLLGVCLLVFVTHSISTLGVGTDTYRYFLLFLLIFVLLFALVLSKIKHKLLRNILAILLIGATLLNISQVAPKSNSPLVQGVDHNKANLLNNIVINLAHDRGYTKGYANYWDASIGTYLSGGSISFLPSLCTDGQTKKFHWLINDNAFDRVADKSFFFVNPDPSAPPTCNLKNIDRQFGKPVEEIKIGNKTLYLYDYDISTRMQNF